MADRPKEAAGWKNSVQNCAWWIWPAVKELTTQAAFKTHSREDGKCKPGPGGVA